MIFPRTLQMLKKSGINKGNAMNYLAFIVKSSTIFVLEKQSAVKPRDSWRTTQRSLPLAYRLPCTPNLKIFILFKIQFYIFSLRLLFVVPGCSGMFRNVPRCSMFATLRPPTSWPQIIQVVASYLHNALLAYFTFSFSWFAISAQSIGYHYQTKRIDFKDLSLLRFNTDRL